MAVRIRLKKMGRKHRPFYRICAMDVRVPRDGKAIEELGYYDPMVKDATRGLFSRGSALITGSASARSRRRKSGC